MNLLIPNLRIEEPIAEINDQVDHQDHKAENKHEASDDGLISLVDGIKHQETHSRQNKYLLDNNRTPYEDRDIETNQCDDRDEPILQSVP